MDSEPETVRKFMSRMTITWSSMPLAMNYDVMVLDLFFRGTKDRLLVRMLFLSLKLLGTYWRKNIRICWWELAILIL